MPDSLNAQTSAVGLVTMLTVISCRLSKQLFKIYKLLPVNRDTKILTKKHDNWSIKEDIRLVSYCK